MGSPNGTSNPIRELLKEAASVFGKNRRVCQILSLGSGLTHVLCVDPPEGIPSGKKLLRTMSADSEMTAKEMLSRLSHLDVYLRLNVDRGMEDASMTDWRDMGAIESHMSAYVDALTEVIENALGRLRDKFGAVTFDQLS